MFETGHWLLEGATRDGQTTDADWGFVGRQLIEGVTIREVRNVPKGNGMITEVFRRDWFDEEIVVDQIFQAVLESHCVSAWHAHEKAVDRLFVNQGTIRVVLYDAREGSSTYGMINEIVAGLHRPALVIIPAMVWHGVQNLVNRPSAVLNLPDRAYQYGSPDHWRVSSDTPAIPYTFRSPTVGGRSNEDQEI